MYVVHLNCLYFIHTGDDYHHDCEQCEVTFCSGQSIATVNITIIDDTEIECNETVNVYILVDDRVKLLTEGVTITIMDDDNGKSLTLYAFYYNKMII